MSYDFKKNGERLRTLRGERSIDSVATDLGISKASYSQYENGNRNPRDEVKIALAEYYGVPVSAIFFAD